MKPTLIYEDSQIAVINKPAGLLIHRSPLASDRYTLTSWLAETFEDDSRGIPRPAHRIDRPTSGLLLTAFTDEALEVLNAAFRSREVHKEYLGITRGWPGQPGDEFLIDLPLKKKNLSPDKTVPGTDVPEQEALTMIKVLDTAELPFPDRRHPATRLALITARPLTGRFHQIRRHLARRGYPLAGDTSHGDTAFNQWLNRGLKTDEPLRLALHAWKIHLPHPVSGKPLSFTAPPPDDLAILISLFLDLSASRDYALL